MPLYQVFSRPQGIDAPALESGAVFVADRFSWGACLLPPVWAAVHGLWLELIAIIAAIVALIALGFVIGDEAALWLYVLMSCGLGFFAADIRATALKRKGYLDKGDLIADGADLAERAYLARELGA